jgi:hypothetical protein
MYMFSKNLNNTLQKFKNQGCLRHGGTCPILPEAETRGLLVQGQPGLYIKTLLCLGLKKKKKLSTHGTSL